MDASLWAKKGNSNLCSYYIKIESCQFPAAIRQKNPVVKYTKLPDFDFDTNVSWPQQSYTLHPRLRRIIEFQDPAMLTTRSLKLDTPTVMASNYTKRKIVTIIEDDESILSQKNFKDSRRPTSVRFTHKAVGTDNEEKRPTTRSRPSTVTKYSKDIKHSAKTKEGSCNTNSIKEKEVNIQKPVNKTKSSYNNNQSKSDQPSNKHTSDKETTRQTPVINMIPKTNTRKSAIASNEREKEIYLIQNKVHETPNSVKSPKKIAERPRVKKTNPQSRNSFSFWDTKTKNKEVIIHAPLEEETKTREINVSQKQTPELFSSEKSTSKVDCATEVDKTIISKNVIVETDKSPEKVNQDTVMDFGIISELIRDRIDTIVTEKEKIENTVFDTLDIPNVTLTKDASKENIVNFCSKSLPNLRSPTLKITSQKEGGECSDPKIAKSTSFIIGRATVTYTTRQKINFQVVSSSEDTTSSLSPSPLKYPMNVVSVFKRRKKYSNSSNESDKKIKSKITLNKGLNEIKYFKCPHEFNSKLVKPSEIISSNSINRGMLQNDYICEQFQRELNFIDSFFESLQYLENSTLSERCLSSSKCENWISKAELVEEHFDNSKFISNLKNSGNIEDTETMVSKSLCLLNLLIRDEQRRAKNLLFVLKMREDALKDFTKSHILWLENKKKQENTDISTLKKKQRGALLKLQFECGEMQRMRKALLSLSEKRKAALIKTKKNIELKLKNNLNIDQIILGKKKLKRSAAADRNVAPLKCFDLSSSECDDSSTSRGKSTKSLGNNTDINPNHLVKVLSAEKCIQTCDSVLRPVLVDEKNHTAAEHFVVVDGGYLNILFNNLCLPQIFSNGKQYEVNEEALKNIVNSANTQQSITGDSDAIVNLMDNCDAGSSSPSTARSLVEEFDQYYKALVDVDKFSEDSTDHVSSPIVICEIKGTLVPVSKCSIDRNSRTKTRDSSETVLGNRSDSSNTSSDVDDSAIPDNLQPIKDKLELESDSDIRPLLISAEDIVAHEQQIPEIRVQPPSTPSSKSSLLQESNLESDSLCPTTTHSSLTSPVHNEAEELRRQQLEIEREIQALEQQQSQLLAVREIPDKPPPPYTPPTDAKPSKSLRKFTVDDTTPDKVFRHIIGPVDCSEPPNTFDIFIKDFCLESIDRHHMDSNDNPWDACNLLPQKPELEPEKLAEKALADIKDVLTCVAPTVVSGVSNRRSDHIDDILFTEWRRYEPEWTALHVDESTVKNQVFESIFQKVLTETIDQYKKTVLGITSISEYNVNIV